VKGMLILFSFPLKIENLEVIAPKCLILRKYLHDFFKEKAQLFPQSPSEKNLSEEGLVKYCNNKKKTEIRWQ